MTAIAKPLYEIVGDLNAIAEVLNENGGELTPELEAQLDALEGAFEDKLARCALMAKNLAAESEKHKAEQERQYARQVQLTKSCAALKGYMKACMEARGVQKVAGIARIQANGQPSIAWTRPIEELPAEYRRVRIEPDYKDVLTAIRAGEAIPDGFTVEHGSHLRLM